MALGPGESDPDGVDRAIGGRVRLRRVQRGLSQEALALDAGMTLPQIRKCESGQSRISCATLMKLAGPLRASAGWLLEGDAARGSGRRPPRQAAHADGSEAAHADNPMLQACLVMAEQAFANLPLPIYLTSSDGVILFCNPAAALFVGRWPRIGQDKWCVSWRLYDLEGKRVAHEDCAMALALKTGKPVRGALAVLERPDGSRQGFIPYPTPLLNRRSELFGGFNALYPLNAKASRCAVPGGDAGAR